MSDALHEGRPWLKHVLSAVKSKRIYRHGCLSLDKDKEDFYKKGLHNMKPYEKKYRPNPFVHQYDMEMHIFLNYNSLKSRELRRLKNKLKIESDEETIDLINKRIDVVKEIGPTGIPREEHLFNASEIRWPTEIINGAFKGEMVRDPWAVERFNALSSNYDYILNFGGGGQGKTWNFMAFGLMLFEHYIYTRNGAKCSFSTVSEDKIKNVGWPHLLKLHGSTEPDISLYAGKSIVGGSYTLKRPGNNDTGGVYRGILAGRNVSDASVIDKLTGTHGHEAYFYLIDEAQSSSSAPITASSNYKATGSPAWVVLTGNYDEDTDTLGSNAKPDDGWEKTDKNTKRWISTIDEAGGCKALVLHFNNENCPAVLDDKIAKRFPHMPNKTKRDKNYSKIKQTNNNKGYRRFWIGFRANDLDEDSVLTAPMIESGGADKPLNLSMSYPINDFISFDGAQGQQDRNPWGHFQDGHDEETEEWVFGLNGPIKDLDRVDDIKNYFSDTSRQLYDICNQLNIKSGNLILDWTNLNGHVSMLREMGMECYPIQYHKKVPDGKTVKGYVGEIEQEIIVNPATNPPMKAHQVCPNRVSLGAWALQQYTINGRVRGMNSEMLSLVSSKTFDDEMLKRKFEDVIDSTNGELLKLDSKKKFIKKRGFSTDILDLWIQIAYYMLVCRGMPVHKEIEQENRQATKEREIKKLIEEEAGQDVISMHNDVWVDDLHEDSTTYYAGYDDEEF